MAVITVTILKQGSRGAEVVDLQHLLLARGGADLDEIVSPDGIFGSLTQIAVLNFQAHQPGSVDGIVDRDTWQALAADQEWPEGVAGRFLRRGDRGQAVRRLQRGLRAQGLYQDAIDGVFGPLTQHAVVRLQVREAVSNTQGIVGPLTFSRAIRNL